MHINTQKPEPRVNSRDGTSLDLHSIFFTLQGEGPFAGRRAIFVRLAGCNLKCPWCDTEYTQGRQIIEPTELIEKVRTLAKQCHLIPGDGDLVVITGGEPFRQPIGLLALELIQRGFIVQIESNGVLEPDPLFMSTVRNYPEYLYVVVSPKTTHINEHIADIADAYKYVVSADNINLRDGLPTRCLDHPASPKGVARPPAGFPREKIYLSPCDEQDAKANARNHKTVADLAMAHGYTAGIQLHKLFDLP